jgi:hypothetical protein
MATATYTIYCDTLSDEHLAEAWLRGGPLRDAEIRRLPIFGAAPSHLKPLLSWERLDWVICRGEEPICTAEFSRHGYTGDNSFQRFARIYRSAELRIPTIYFTPFARARLNELDTGRSNPRNVAPELFQVMKALSHKFDTPCVGISWPTDPTGTPLPLTSPATVSARNEIVRLVHHLVERGNPGSNLSLESDFPDTIEVMKTQAALPFRGSSTRGNVSMPLEVQQPGWVLDWLPDGYFSMGKADKLLASAALRHVERRPLLPAHANNPFWQGEGEAYVLFLGYQWRPDPAAGLIALSSANAIARDVPLIVVWPRVFYEAAEMHTTFTSALQEFRASGKGLLRDEAVHLGLSKDSMDALRTRISIDPNQYGVYTPGSKIGRVLRDTASIIILADAVLNLRP